MSRPLLQLTPETRAKIRSVHRLVNRKITYQKDGITHPHLSVPEHWDILLEGGHGDCEDYALTKRHYLRNEFPQWHYCFRIATCWMVPRDDSSYHATLLVQTDGGTFILDNNFRDIVTFGSVNWRWHKIENADSPTGWSNLSA